MTKSLSIVLSVFLILALCLSLAACGDKADGKSEEKATEAVTEKPTDPPTEAPTEPPTEPPTDPPTEAPTKAPVKYDADLGGYRVGDALLTLTEVSDDISFLTDFQAQYLPDVDQWVALTFEISGNLTQFDLSRFISCIEVEDCKEELDSITHGPDGYLVDQVYLLYSAPAGYEISEDKVHIGE